MSLISAITYFIPFQIGPGRPQEQSEPTEEVNYFCVSPENETDWDAALLEFAHNQCQLSQLNIEQVPAEVREQFISARGDDPVSPRSIRRNRWEIMADYFDSTWVFSPLAWLIRGLAGPDYCRGALIAVNEEEICQSLSEAFPSPQPELAPQPVCPVCPTPRPRSRPVEITPQGQTPAPQPEPVRQPRRPREGTPPTKVRPRPPVKVNV